jgi:hypothetical protein
MMKMVNEYLSPEEAEARSPYAQKPSNAGQETLRAEAVAGQQVGFRGSYGGASGQAAQNYDDRQMNNLIHYREQWLLRYMVWHNRRCISHMNSMTFVHPHDAPRNHPMRKYGR